MTLFDYPDKHPVLVTFWLLCILGAWSARAANLTLPREE